MTVQPKPRRGCGGGGGDLLYLRSGGNFAQGTNTDGNSHNNTRCGAESNAVLC